MKRRLLIAFALIVIALWVGNTTRFATVPPDRVPGLLAHRGVHQIYAGKDRTNDTCSANPIFPADHGFIANTLPAMQAAFAAGAQVVEIDVHLTADGVFAVFHDWTLDCQTDGTGVTHEQTMDRLRQLDLGYGYTSDGVTFPLRGTAGPMPTLTEVLEAGLGGQFLINFKSNRRDEGAPLAALISDPAYRAQVFGVYGGTRPTQDAIVALPGLRGYDRPALKRCLIRYALTGWTGRVPAVCRDMIIAVPLEYAPLLWGWPHRFTARMRAAGTTVILLGPDDGSGFSNGFDDADALARVPPHFDGLIWTNRIEVIGPMMDILTQ